MTRKIDEAFDGAEVVYAKSWGSRDFYGEPKETWRPRADYRKEWIVDERKMAAHQRAVFMHCLPVRRNVIVTDAVIDSPAQSSSTRRKIACTRRRSRDGKAVS